MTLVDEARRVDPDGGLVAAFGADYVDAFRINGTRGATARAWADSSLHGSRGLFGSIVWHGLLRFDLLPHDAPGSAFGWTVSTCEPALMVMDTDGSLAAGRMVFVIDGDAVTWTTMLRYHRAEARWLWAVIGNGHRAIGPRCLNGAAAHLIGARS
ncbi:MAG: hypothetical protein H0W70_14310 [Actinobacteria bacterium]|nr:hypothetical protein [Actinomycetota bacterium]MBA3655353.1 hypothetical protein [Actinomycetota bacterium]